MASIEEILLRVTGDTDSARRELAELGAELNTLDAEKATAEIDLDETPLRDKLAAARQDLARFARETAEATASVNTDVARAKLDELEMALREVGATETNAKVDVSTASALAKIEVLKRELSSIDDRRAGPLDIKGPLIPGAGQDRSSVVRGLAGVESAASGVEKAMAGMGSEAGTATGELTVLGAESGPLILILAALATAAVAAATALAAVGTAGLATLIPFGVLLAGVIANFKGLGGELRAAVGPFLAAFRNATAGAAVAIFHGLAGALRTIGTILPHLHGAFTRLGQAIGGAFQKIANEFAKPVWVQFFNFLINAAARIVPPLTQAFIAFANILRQIIRAAMPFLIRGLQQFAGWLTAIGNRKGNVAAIRDFLRQTLPFIGALVRATAHFVGFIILIGEKTAPIFTSLFDHLSPIIDALSTMVGWISDFYNFLKPILDLLNKIKDAADAISPSGIASNIPVIGGPISQGLNFAGLAGGTPNWRGGMALVGELGPELVTLPRGAEVFPHSITRAFMAEMGGTLGKIPGLAAGTGGGIAHHNTAHLNISVPGGGHPDARATVASISRNLRARGFELE